MIESLETLRQYLAFPFVQNALAAGLLVALAAALLGVTLVLRRLSYIGDGLSHVAFGSMAVAGALQFADRLSLSPRSPPSAPFSSCAADAARRCAATPRSPCFRSARWRSATSS